MTINLPISKSIANRLLVVKALRGDDLSSFSISYSTPDDVRLMHNILLKNQSERISDTTTTEKIINCQNCGTAMRFLTAYFAQKQGLEVVLCGSERMNERPIGQLVNVLKDLGASIEYLNQEGYPPIRIKGKELKKKPIVINDPISTQFISALMLIKVEVTTNCQSPYIDMTKAVINSKEGDIEYDWSSAAFWYEWVAIHGGELFLVGLRKNSIQGDRAVVDIFRQLGVETTFEEQGILIKRSSQILPPTVNIDFSDFPDLYPAVFATCHRLGIKMNFSGLERLPLKESNRIEAMEQILVCSNQCNSFADHRIAMALLCADYHTDDTCCISKSYPTFLEQWKQLQ